MISLFLTRPAVNYFYRFIHFLKNNKCCCCCWSACVSKCFICLWRLCLFLLPSHNTWRKEERTCIDDLNEPRVSHFVHKRKGEKFKWNFEIKEKFYFFLNLFKTKIWIQMFCCVYENTALVAIRYSPFCDAILKTNAANSFDTSFVAKGSTSETRALILHSLLFLMLSSS